MNIKRVDRYNDKRFSKTVLLQNGAYDIDGEPYEVEIINSECAVIRGKDTEKYLSLIDKFRFNAPHISRFINSDGTRILNFIPTEQFSLPLNLIQPSQFYVSKQKLQAVSCLLKNLKTLLFQ